MQYEFHPAANIFPLMTGEAFERLKADIEHRTQQECIEVFEGKILDGRNRYLACMALGYEPDIIELEEPGNPVEYVLSKNLHRRQLKASQRAMCAAKLAGLPVGSNQHSKEDSSNDLPSANAAAVFSVGVASVKRALTVLRKGCKELIAACEASEWSVSLACRLIEHEPDKRKQAAIVKAGAVEFRSSISTPTIPHDAVDIAEQVKSLVHGEHAEHVIGALDRVLHDVDDRPYFDRFKVVWDAADDMGRAAIRAFVLGDDVV